MIPVDQEIESFEDGDCMRACIASLLELPLTTVPNFAENNAANFYEFLTDFLSLYGLKAVDICFADKQGTEAIKDCVLIATGVSPRALNDDQKHAVIWLNGKILHDPHPSKAGLFGDPDRYTILFPKDLTDCLFYEVVRLLPNDKKKMMEYIEELFEGVTDDTN